MDSQPCFGFVGVKRSARASCMKDMGCVHTKGSGNRFKVDAVSMLRDRLESFDEPFIKAVLLFGSTARAESGERSDVDLLVLCEGFDTEDIVARRKLVYRLLKEVVGDVFEDLTVIDMELVEFLKPKEISSLLLNIYWDAHVVHDKTGTIEDFLRRVRGSIAESGLKRVRDGRAYYWVLPEPLKEVRIL